MALGTIDELHAGRVRYIRIVGRRYFCERNSDDGAALLFRGTV